MLFIPRHTSAYRFASNASGRPGTAYGQTITAGGSAHTLSASFTTIITPDFDVWSLYVCISEINVTNSDTPFAVNLYLGASSAEVLFIQGIDGNMATSISATPGKMYWFPVYIPSGTRISAKAQAATGSDTCQLLVRAFGGGKQPHWVGTGVETLGFNSGTSKGTTVTPGSTSEGTFTAIGTSTHSYGYVQPMRGGNTDGSIVAGVTAADIGTGGAAIDGLSDFLYPCNGNEWVTNLETGRFCHIAAGTALQIAAQHSGTAENTDFYIYGVY